MSLELKNITKSFGEKRVIFSFSYKFNSAGLYALKGESGAGKTTLLRIIAGLDTDYSGEVVSDEKSLSFAFQEYRLFPTLAAIENVTIVFSERNNEAVLKKAENLLLTLGLKKEDLSLLPSELSGGMKQRVSIARALISDSKILILDEPTKELDAHNALLVRDMLQKEAEKRLVIISTHSDLDLSLPNINIISL